MIDDEAARWRIAKILGAIVDQLAAVHTERKTQEPALTARIGQALETALQDANFRGEGEPDYVISITTHDISDRGRLSLEKASGIDLYINISVRTPKPISKAIVIQAKKGRGRSGINEQCKKMLDRTDAAYGWFYGPEGTTVVDAAELIDHPESLVRKLTLRSPAEVFDAVLKCSEGDPGISLSPVLPTAEALRDKLDELRAPSGVSFEVRRRRRDGDPPEDATGP